MKVVFLGCTKFSSVLLENLIRAGISIEALFYIPEYFKISYSKDKIRNYNYSNITELSRERNIPTYEVNSVDGKRLKDYMEVFNSIRPDVILVLGWYYIVPKKIRESAQFGAWGIHASLLPKYAGNAPLVWAMINGEEKTGVTLFRLSSGIDDGDIIVQESLPILINDTINDLYERATNVSSKILINTLQNVNNIQFKSQDKSKIEVYPPRRPEDGRIDFSRTAKEIYNFIRAQTYPYPGAFCIFNGDKMIIWHAKMYDEFNDYSASPGKVELILDSGGVVISTGNGGILLLDVEYQGKKIKPSKILKSKKERLY